jgi:predicted Zn-dependent protease with MMP-like domain
LPGVAACRPQASRAPFPRLLAGVAVRIIMASRGPSDWVGARAPTAAEIERIGRQVLAELPALFRAHVQGVVIKVEDFPDEETEREMELESPYDLLGLYRGVPVGHGSGLGPPRQDVDMIFLYRAPLLNYWCETGEPLDDIVRNTLIHEIGHHFGYSDDDMDRIEFGE